jgi:hypothetical protein
MNPEIICILNVFKRVEYLDEQLDAILKQSIPPKKIIIWNNNPEVNLNKYVSDDIIVISSSHNLGVWGRFFSQYYLLSGEFVCVFDDDTIPGNNWFKNCIDTINKHNALLGTIGVIFNKGNTYNTLTRFGWDGENEYPMIVDIVGHSWFFRKEWISTLIKDLPNIDRQLICGEDMHLSFVLQKYLNIPVIVPPHPKSDISLWGADPIKSKEYGTDENSISMKEGFWIKFSNALKYNIDKGFETINNKAIIIKNYSSCLDYFIGRIINKKNFALMRCADGEYSISNNKSIKVQASDDWQFNENSILSIHFNETLKMLQTNVFYGISGPSDSKEICKYWYENIPNIHNITYSNMFVNTNYNRWENFLKNLDYNCVLISQMCPANERLGILRIIEYLHIDKYLVNNWDAEYEKYFIIISKLARSYTNTLFLFSAGPLSNVFIHRMYLENPNNTYIDCGSSLDLLTKGVYTRAYQYNRNDYVDKEKLPIVYTGINEFSKKPNNNIIIEFKLFDTLSTYDMKYNDGYAWSRVYEYPTVLDYIRKLSSFQNPHIHNSSWGFQGIHLLFKEQLDLFSNNCLHTDIKESLLPNTGIYDITKAPDINYNEKFDFVLNISTVEEVDFNHWIIINNLLKQVKNGGYLIITFDLPGLDINLIENKLNLKLYRPANLLNGNTSILQNNSCRYLNCGLLIIQKN